MGGWIFFKRVGALRGYFKGFLKTYTPFLAKRGAIFRDLVQGLNLRFNAVFIFDKTMVFIDVFNCVKASINIISYLT